MVLSGSQEELNSRDVHNVVRVFGGEIGYYTHDNVFGFSEFDFEAVIAGNAALAILADKRGVDYTTRTKDVDLFTTQDFSDLEAFESLPHATMSRDDSSQYNYNISTVGYADKTPSVFIDVITSFEEAFDMDSTRDAEVIESMLTEEIERGELFYDDGVTVYLPELETLRGTFVRAERDYEDRIKFIDEILM